MDVVGINAMLGSFKSSKSLVVCPLPKMEARVAFISSSVGNEPKLDLRFDLLGILRMSDC